MHPLRTDLSPIWNFTALRCAPGRKLAARLTPAGRGFFGATLLFAGGAALLPETQAHAALAFACGAWGAALLAARFARPPVRLRLLPPGRVRAGEVALVEAEVEVERSARGLPAAAAAAGELRLVPEALPPGVTSLAPEGAPVPPLHPGERARVRLGLRCLRRGRIEICVRAATPFPFGWCLAPGPAERCAFLVVPDFVPLDRLHLPGGRRHHPEGVALASSVGDSQEYLGNREYRSGDSLRSIDWRATARLGRPVVREYREEYFLRTAIVLDTHVPPEPPGARGAAARAARRRAFERAVSAAAAVADALLRNDSLVELCAAGPSLFRLTAGRSLAHLDQVLEVLAHVEERPEPAFGEIGPELAENLSRTAAVVCLFLDWDEARRRFVAGLRDQGTAVRLILCGEGPWSRDPALDRAWLGEVTRLGATSAPGGEAL